MPKRLSRFAFAAAILAAAAMAAIYAVRTQSPIAGQATTECNDGIDNDGDGKVDGVKNAVTDVNATRTFGGDGWDVIKFLTIDNHYMTYRDGEAIDEDAATTQRICSLAGFSTVQSVSGKNFSSCGDNWVARWDASQNRWIQSGPYNACAIQPFIRTLVCKAKVGACADNMDNDGDGKIDLSDSGCASITDDSEVPHDPDCTSLSVGFERPRQCQDGTDNDGDGAIDYPADVGCDSATDDDERAQCEDGVDNDGDGANNYPNDFSCADAKDNDETNPKPQCSDGADNDGDGARDHPSDFSCTSKQDNDEASPRSQCQDAADNDGDGTIDLLDFSCSGNAQHNDEANPKPQCGDGADNDGDGSIDFPVDVSCSDRQDNDETNPRPQCNDGVDNDGDGAVDHPADFGCTDKQAQTEDSSKAQCQDGADNDGDGAVDLLDFSCGQNRQQNSESTPKALCEDGADNDGDGKTDFPEDPGCDSKQDNDEKGLCGDGVDNDGDGAVDHPADFSCADTNDNDEASPKAQCQDGTDNDGDGDIDYPEDIGCENAQDNVETNPPPQCRDTLDNDADGFTDYPADVSCSSRNDNDERDPIMLCQDGLDNDEDGLTDTADPGCDEAQDNTEEGEACVSPSVLIIALQPPPYPSQPTEVIEMRKIGVNVTYHSRLTLPVFTEQYIKQFSVVWLLNGCGEASRLLSASEVAAVKNYYLANGNLILSPGDFVGKTSANAQECISRINQIAENLGARFNGMRSESPAGCKPAQSTHGLLAGITQVYRQFSAPIEVTGSPSWGTNKISLQGTVGAGEALAITTASRGKGAVLLLPQDSMLRDQCTGKLGYKNILGFFGFKQGCECTIQNGAAVPMNSQSLAFLPVQNHGIWNRLMGFFADTNITENSLTAATIPKYTFTCTNGKTPAVRTVQLAGAMADAPYAGVNIYDRSSTTITLEDGDKVYIGGNGQTHGTDDEIHVMAYGTQIVSYVVGGCSGHIEHQSEPVDITGIFSTIGTQSVRAEFVDTCRTKIGHTAYTLSIVNCDKGTSTSSAGSTNSAASNTRLPTQSSSSSAQWKCTLNQCNDKIDNDNDGTIDLNDEGCLDISDSTEQELVESMNGGSCAVVSQESTGSGQLRILCPTGFVVTGGGWRDYTVTNKSNDISRPLKGDEGWECEKNAVGSGAACVAVCCDASILETRVITATGPMNSRLFPQCPIGYSILGGGYADMTPDKDEDILRAEENGWRCYDNDSVATGSLCYAICGRRKDETELSCQTQQKVGRLDKPVAVACPTGTVVVSGGFDDNSKGNDDTDTNAPTGNAWLCYDDYGDSPIDSTSVCYANCCTLPSLGGNSSSQPPEPGPCNMQKGSDVVADTCAGTAANGMCQTPYYEDITFANGGFATPPHVIVTPRRIPVDTAGCAEGSTDKIICKPESITKTGFRLVCSGSPLKNACGSQHNWYSKASADWLAVDKTSTCGAQTGHNFKPTCTPMTSNGFCNSGMGYTSTLTFPSVFATTPKMLVTPETLSDQAGCIDGTTDTITCYAGSATEANAQISCSGSANDISATCGNDNGRYTQGAAGWLAMPSTPTCRVEQGKSTATTCVGQLSGGTCTRPFEVTVPFSPAFTAPPIVMISPAQISKAPTCSGNATGTDTLVCELITVTTTNFTARCSGSFAVDICGTGTNVNYTQGEFSYIAIDAGCSVPPGSSSTSRSALSGGSSLSSASSRSSLSTSSRSGLSSVSTASSRPSSSSLSASRGQSSTSQKSISSIRAFSSVSSAPSSGARSTAMSSQKSPSGACPPDTCNEGGSIVCAVTGKHCNNLDSPPCFRCIDSSEASNEAPADAQDNANQSDGLAAQLGVGLECVSDADCATSLCIDGSCQACREDTPCHDDKQCVVLVCRNPIDRPAAPVFALQNLCANGSVDDGEECDDGNVRDGDGCSGSCERETGFCGDGSVQEALGEQCEPGQATTGLFQCSGDCHIVRSQTCGNGALDPGEECDRATENSDAPNSDCRTNCSLGRCGDGILDEQTEECDDGNRVSSDGCDRTCIVERGATLATGVRMSPLTLGTSSSGGPLHAIYPVRPAASGVGIQNPALQVTYVQQVPLGQTGPASLAAAAMGAATGVAWMRRRKRKTKK